MERRAGWQPTEKPMSAFCVNGMTEPLAKTLAARKWQQVVTCLPGARTGASHSSNA